MELVIRSNVRYLQPKPQFRPVPLLWTGNLFHLTPPGTASPGAIGRLRGGENV